jgi:hypothetical protein
MKVRTLRAHRNGFGEKFLKADGDEYEHPHPEGDIVAGLIENASERKRSKPKAAE